MTGRSYRINKLIEDGYVTLSEYVKNNNMDIVARKRLVKVIQEEATYSKDFEIIPTPTKRKPGCVFYFIKSDYIFNEAEHSELFKITRPKTIKERGIEFFGGEFIPVCDFSRMNDLTKNQEQSLRMRKRFNPDDFKIFEGILFVRQNYVFIDEGVRKSGSYVANVIDVIHVLVKHYQYLSSLITIENGIAFILGNEIKYNGQRAYFNENIDVMFYLRDIIISKEGQDLKYNNTVDYCPNHLIQSFN